MAEFIGVEQKRAAIVLAETLNYGEAAKQLRVEESALKSQIRALESQLCLLLFIDDVEDTRLTDDGRLLICAFREALELQRED
jgi:DNA-binding transcriptional LysR family regulator